MTITSYNQFFKMKSHLATLLTIQVIALLFTTTFQAWTLPTNCTLADRDDGNIYWNSTCILKVEMETAPANTKDVDTNPVTVAAGTCINGAKKYINVNGLTLAGSIDTQVSPDASICWAAKAYQEMWPAASGDTGCDQYNQHLVLQKSYEHRFDTPFFQTTEATNKMEKFEFNNGSCDIITVGKTGLDVNAQVLEVLEHLLHAVNNNGFNFAMPKFFGVNTNTESLLKCAMDEAITNGVFVTTSYNNPNMTTSAKNRLLLQEYFYWLVGYDNVGCARYLWRGQWY